MPQLLLINALLTLAKASVAVPLYQAMLVAFCTSAAGVGGVLVLVEGLDRLGGRRLVEALEGLLRRAGG